MKALHLIVASALCAALVSPVWADNDKNKGKGHDNNNDRGHSGRVEGGAVKQAPTVIVVTDRDRNTIHTYYRTDFVSGNCPPGLAKKDNGCLPPGQAKKLWNVGQPLPPTIVYYPLPQPLMTQLPPPPAPVAPAPTSAAVTRCRNFARCPMKRRRFWERGDTFISR